MAGYGRATGESGKDGNPRPHGGRLPISLDSEKITSGGSRLSRQPQPVSQENPVAERSKHQDKIIRNYYENRDAIALQRLAELVGELYLAEGKARQRSWKHIVTALEKLKIKPDRIEHLVQQDNPSLLAKLVEELMAKQ
jgi:hypothetical protein